MGGPERCSTEKGAKIMGSPLWDGRHTKKNAVPLRGSSLLLVLKCDVREKLLPCLTSCRQSLVSPPLSLPTNAVWIGASELHSQLAWRGGTECVLRCKFLGRSRVCDARTLAWCRVRASPAAAGADERVHCGRCVSVCV